jgi:hypothetical protein
VPVERAQEVEREACGVDICYKEGLVVFLSCKNILQCRMVRRKSKEKGVGDERRAY